jgi:hypothetical protein
MSLCGLKLILPRAMLSGPPAIPQLCVCHGVGSHDLERTRSADEYRVAYRRRPVVSALALYPSLHPHLSRLCL